MAAELLGRLDVSMLLLWDRGFFSYKLWQDLLLRGCAVLARVKVGLVLLPTQQLADGSYLARIYPCYSMRNKGRGGLVVRVIRYTHDDERRAGCGLEHVLLTSLLDAQAHPARELIVLYHERWEVELTFDEQKTHQNPWRVSKSADLRSETPLGVLQEIYALSIGHYATRALMAAAAHSEGLDPDRLSFTGCLRVLRNRLGEFPPQPGARQRWLESLVAELAAEQIEPRRNRVNPRVVRVKMSKFKKKRKEHRGLRPLDRTFEETIIVQGAA